MNQKKQMNLTQKTQQTNKNKRFVTLIIALGTLLALGFYAVTDPTNIPYDHALTGADWIGAGICHRITSRTFTVYGRQLPLCARCTGIYLGIVLSFLILILAGRGRRVNMPKMPILLAMLGLVAIMGIDGVNSYTHFFPNFPHVYEPRNWLRLVTGMGAGLAMGIFVFPALTQTLWQDQEYKPVLNNFGELMLLFLVAGITIALVLSNQPAILYVLGLVSAAGVLLILTTINVVMLLTLMKKDGRAVNWRDTAVPLSIALIIAIAQVSLITLMRLNLLGTTTGFPGLG